MIIQAQTLVVSQDVQAELTMLSAAIKANAGQPQLVAHLIARHDALTKNAGLKPYDAREQACS